MHHTFLFLTFFVPKFSIICSTCLVLDSIDFIVNFCGLFALVKSINYIIFWIIIYDSIKIDD
jgi:hypothetical protein